MILISLPYKKNISFPFKSICNDDNNCQHSYFLQIIASKISLRTAKIQRQAGSNKLLSQTARMVWKYSSPAGKLIIMTKLLILLQIGSALCLGLEWTRNWGQLTITWSRYLQVQACYIYCSSVKYLTHTADSTRRNLKH